MEKEAVYMKSRQAEATTEAVKEHVEESKMQLAETIARMTEGLMRTHGIFLPQGARAQFEAKAIMFIEETPGISQQIEEQIRKSMTRPPAA